MPAPSQHEFSEKVALITDGTNPIGRAVAMQLALYGCYVIVGCPSFSEMEKRALDELTSLGTLASSVKADASTVEGAKYLIEKVEGLYGRLDLLVNCLKYRADSTFGNIDEESFDKTVSVNLKSAFFVTRESMDLMKSRPKAKIVNIVSACDSDASATNVVFAAVNTALIGLTEALSRTLPDKFRVNAVAVSEREKTVSRFDDLDDKLFRPKKGADPDDVARAVLYLLSSESIGINGQVLKVE